MNTIVIIARQTDWQAAQKTGTYEQSTVDSTLAEVGFIHCTLPNQTIEVANRKYQGSDNLVVLLIDADKVTSEIKYEGARSGRAGTFPHIYGPLNIDAVYATTPLQKNEEGEFVAPTELKEAQHMNDFNHTVKAMVDTPPISNEDLKRRKE